MGRIYRTDQYDKKEGRTTANDADGDQIVIRTNGTILSPRFPVSKVALQAGQTHYIRLENKIRLLLAPRIDRDSYKPSSRRRVVRDDSGGVGERSALWLPAKHFNVRTRNSVTVCETPNSNRLTEQANVFGRIWEFRSLSPKFLPVCDGTVGPVENPDRTVALRNLGYQVCSPGFELDPQTWPRIGP